MFIQFLLKVDYFILIDLNLAGVLANRSKSDIGERTCIYSFVVMVIKKARWMTLNDLINRLQLHQSNWINQLQDVIRSLFNFYRQTSFKVPINNFITSVKNVQYNIG